jgi:hypothetical protein
LFIVVCFAPNQTEGKKVARKTYRVEIKGMSTFVGYVTAESEDEAYQIAVDEDMSEWLFEDIVDAQYELEEM